MASQHTTRRAGFTLIELLIVVVIIGILVAIAIPKFSQTKERAVVAKMRSDLRNLASSQEAYFNEHLTYYSGALPSAAMAFAPSTGVSISMGTVNAAGWGAFATSTGTTVECQLYVGSGGPMSVALQEGSVACTSP
jgi:prepilin-type N-terminal cleavage/methylation domain-containing protein